MKSKNLFFPVVIGALFLSSCGENSINESNGNTAIIKTGGNAEDLANDALRELNNGDLDSALSFINRAISLEESKADYYTYRGDIYKALNILDSSEASYSKAIELDSINLNAYMGRGGIRLDKGQLDEAMHDYVNVLNIDSSYEPAKHNIETIESIKKIKQE